ncbi:hypothetical protein LPJ66_008423 [Kickxella alabastrina]|uniref:Uncharacterized protein n=1 Tax=Kickxella alabastrina TaxID=61397 RepID=A0ACC1I6R6_9FUNG|nr:hypothetical protein LPJ66_008423 [Kickxella alabastrina]
MELTTTRSQRQNAGNKMHAMVEEERAKMQSGEVVASDDDEDFSKNADIEDVVDSDFAETDSEDEKVEEDASKAAEAMLERAERRQRRKATKNRIIVPQFASTTRTTRTAKPKEPMKILEPDSAGDISAEAGGLKRRKMLEQAVRFSSRSSVLRKTLESEALVQEREFLAEIKRGRKRHRHIDGSEDSSVAHNNLTQDQLLEEAKQTEIENIEKLNTFQQQEAEDKILQRRLASRKAPLIIRPVVHYKSSVENLNIGDADVHDTGDQRRVVRTDYALDMVDDENYPLNPWARHVAVVPPKLCAVTGLPARYFHPRAKVPYANARAYRILEELVLGEHAFFYDIGVWSSTAISDD